MSNKPEPPTAFDVEGFRRWGKALVDRIADYHAGIEQRPVQPVVQPGALRAHLPPSAPRQGEPYEALLADVERLILPALTHWQSPSFFAYFPSNISAPSVLGELLSAGLGVQGMLWATSPACTELESHVLDWLVDELGLPQAFKTTGSGGGVIQDTASSATLCALLAARERVTEGRCNRDGVREPLVAYCSTQTHSSMQKAVRIAGIGDAHLRLIDVDERFAMQPDALRQAILADRAAGRVPFFVCATLGTTSSMAFDPLPPLVELCRELGLWLHVDAAMAGSAMLCPELRPLQAGVAHVDSYCFNAHKWLLTNFDCDCFYVRRRADLLRALSILPEYLRNQASESGAVIDYRDWQIPLGRRFRALKLWFVLRHFGIEGLQAMIREHVRLAQRFGEWIAADADFELVVPPALNLVCFRHRAGDAVSERLLQAMNATGRLYLTHTKLRDQYVLRMSIGQAATSEHHVATAWQTIRALAASLRP